MGEIVNLKLLRKRKKREAKEVEAEANRVRFGTPKAQRKLSEARHEADEKRLDGHKIGE